MRVLLIRPLYERKAISPNFPIGLAYLATALRRAGHRPEILDLPIKADPWGELKTVLAHDFYPLVGISALTVQYPGAIQVAKAVRRLVPAVRLVLGGPHPTALPAESLRESGADFVVRGEGEVALVRLADALETGEGLCDVPGLVFREAGGEGIRSNPQPEIRPTADSLGFPDYSLVDLGPYLRLPMSEYVRPNARPMQIVTSRGCVFGCTYCHRLFGREFRARSAESVVAEIEYLNREHRINEFLIYDDIFNLDIRRAKRTFRLVLDAGVKAGFSFPNGLRAVPMDEELMSLMARAGVHTVTVGIESASERVREMIQRRLDLRQVEEFLLLAKRYRMRTQAFFMIGFPGEKPEEIAMTVRYARRLSSLDYAFFSFATPYPGTELANQALRQGLKIELGVGSLDYYVPHVWSGRTGYRSLKWWRLTASLAFYSTPRRIFRLLGQVGSPNFVKMYVKSALRTLHMLTWRPGAHS